MNERNQTMKTGTILRYIKETRPMAAKPGARATVISHEEAVALGFSLDSLEEAKKPGQALIRWREDPLRGGQQHGTYPLDMFEEVLTPDSRDRKITDLEHSNSEMKATLRNRDARVASLLEIQDALVGSLHVLADNAEDEGQQDLAEEVDTLLAEHSLKPRKQEYTIEILVPTRLHLHVTARSANHARSLYEAGDVNWNVADGEVQDDDIKVLDISKGSL